MSAPMRLAMELRGASEHVRGNRASPTGSGWSSGPVTKRTALPYRPSPGGRGKRIGLVGVVDAALEVPLRLAPRLAELHAVAALDLEPVDHRRRPAAPWTVPMIVA